MNITEILQSIPDGTLAVVVTVWLFLRYYHKSPPSPPSPPGGSDYYPPG